MMSYSEPPMMVEVPVGRPDSGNLGEVTAYGGGNAIVRDARIIVHEDGNAARVFRSTNPAWARWTAPLNADEVISQAFSILPPKETSLKAEMQELEVRTAADIKRLSTMVEELRRVVELTSATQGVPEFGAPSAPIEVALCPSLDDLRNALSREIAGDGWFDVFDWAADERVAAPPVILAAAMEGVKSKDPAVRVAAGRVLAGSSQRELIALVAQAAATEANAYTRKALESAVRVAQV